MHFLSLQGFSQEAFFSILRLAAVLKKDYSTYGNALQGKQIGLLFEKPSTRTRISFEAGINRLGGKALVLSGKEIQLARGESLADTARVMSQYLDALMVRTFSQKRLEELASYSSIPVINGLSDTLHPCQALADYQTIAENKSGKIKICYSGDGQSNVAHSLLLGAGLYGADISIATHKKYKPLPELVKIVQSQGSTVELVDDPKKAAENADIFYTDIWVSMGEAGGETANKAGNDKAKKIIKQKKKLMHPFQLNQKLLSKGKEDAIVLHCLPAHKGEEITEKVFESPQSKVFEQAQNRMHAQMALLLYLFGKSEAKAQ